jgi:hypothetical protein
MAGRRPSIRWDGSRVLAQVSAGGLQGVERACEHLLTESRKEVPLDEGTLERSGTVTLDRANMRGAVSYDTPYARRQHEDLSLRHAGGRKAKYLEDPLNAERATIAAIIAAAVRRGLS